MRFVGVIDLEYARFDGGALYYQIVGGDGLYYKEVLSSGYDGVIVEIGSDAPVEAERTLVLKFFLVGIFLETAYLKSLVGVLHCVFGIECTFLFDYPEVDILYAGGIAFEEIGDFDVG